MVTHINPSVILQIIRMAQILSDSHGVRIKLKTTQPIEYPLWCKKSITVIYPVIDWFKISQLNGKRVMVIYKLHV